MAEARASCRTCVRIGSARSMARVRATSRALGVLKPRVDAGDDELMRLPEGEAREAEVDRAGLDCSSCMPTINKKM